MFSLWSRMDLLPRAPNSFSCVLVNVRLLGGGLHFTLSRAHGLHPNFNMLGPREMLFTQCICSAKFACRHLLEPLSWAFSTSYSLFGGSNVSLTLLMASMY